MKRARTLLVALALAFGSLIGCHGGTRIHATQARGATFDYRTFSLSEDRAKLPSGFEPSHVELGVRRHVGEVLATELAKRGYVVDDANPDLEIVVASGHRPNRFRGGGGLEYDTTLLSDETLVVEVWDVDARDIVWEGIIEGYFDHGVGTDEARLRADLTNLVSTFPNAASPRIAASPCRDVGIVTAHPCR